MRRLLLVLLVACGGSSGSSSSSSTPAQQSLVVQPMAGGSLAIAGPGGTVQLGAYHNQADPGGYGSMLTLVQATWSSSMASVATVDQDGVVTAVASGSAVITAKAGGSSGNATVTVGAMMSGP